MRERMEFVWVHYGGELAIGLSLVLAMCAVLWRPDGAVALEETGRLAGVVGELQAAGAPKGLFPEVLDSERQLVTGGFKSPAPVSVGPLGATWTHHRLPEVSVKWLPLDARVVTHPSALTASVTTDGEAVRVRWTAPPMKGPHPMAPKTPQPRALLLGYVLTRVRIGAAEAPVRRWLPPVPDALVDREVEPDVRYRYTLRAAFEAHRPGVKPGPMNTFGGVLEEATIGPRAGQVVRWSKVLRSGEVRTRLQYQVRYVRQANAEATLQFRVRRAGEWVETTRVMVAGGEYVIGSRRLVYLGNRYERRGRRRARVAYVEEQPVAMRALGVDWGTRLIAVELGRWGG